MNDKQVSIKKTLDNHGRITLPIEFRKLLGLSNNDNVEITLILNNKKRSIEIRKV